MFFEHGQYSDPTSMAHRAVNDPSTRPNTREDNDPDDSGGFDRNKFRKTMPSNSRFNAATPMERNSKKRPADPSKSPTQSHVSTVTNYAPPWSSPKFQPPTPMKKGMTGDEEPRFRRTHSVAVRKDVPEERRKSQRPLINFKEIGKSVANKFKKKDSKKMPTPDKTRMSAPVLSLAESSSSQPDLPTTSSAAEAAVKSPKKVIRASCSLKMQPEDRMKMFQKMGREQSMKVSNVQRMQRERQRDFTLVPGPGRASLEAKTLSVAMSMNSIDSMVVISSPSRRSESLSLVDEDVEPVFKNSLTNKNVTSSQVASLKNQNQNEIQKLSSGPSFTSTPRLSGSVTPQSPTISNVRSVSESSFCLMTSNDATPAPTRNIINGNQMNDTMYFSTVGLSNAGRNTPSTPVPMAPLPLQGLSTASLASTSTTPTPNNFTVKQEIIEQHESGSSHCPSIASTSTSPADLQDLRLDNLQRVFAQPDQLNDLWIVSKTIREMQLSLDANMPALNRLRIRLEEIEREKILLLEAKTDAPNHDDMRRMWNMCREYLQLNGQYADANMKVLEANHWLPRLEMRRNELLSQSPPPMSVPASFV